MSTGAGYHRGGSRQDYATPDDGFNNSGGTACDWFKEHVMGITSNRPAQP